MDGSLNDECWHRRQAKAEKFWAILHQKK